MLDDRKKQILNFVVSTYMATGEPVGSKALIERNNLTVSSATIRNEMLELERLGYLCKPHTSAGRIPSSEGLRFYAKNTSNSYSLSQREMSLLVPAFRSCVGLMEMLKTATNCLAEFTGCTVFSAAPAYGDGCFNFEVMPAGNKTIAIMAISRNGAVKSVFSRVETDVTPDDAMKMTKILNTVFAGLPVNQIGSVRLMLFKNELNKNCPQYDCVVVPVMNLVDQIKSYELCISGSSNLLSYPEFSNIEAAREYMELLNRREDILNELLQTGEEGKISIKIGDETNLIKTADAGVVSVNQKDRIPLIIGVLGPARMNYSRIIAGCRHVVMQLKEQIAHDENMN